MLSFENSLELGQGGCALDDEDKAFFLVGFHAAAAGCGANQVELWAFHNHFADCIVYDQQLVQASAPLVADSLAIGARLFGIGLRRRSEELRYLAGRNSKLLERFRGDRIAFLTFVAELADEPDADYSADRV